MMPRGPKGQKRPADVIGNAVRVMQIATGEAEEEYETKPEMQFDPRGGGRGRQGRRATLSLARRFAGRPVFGDHLVRRGRLPCH